MSYKTCPLCGNDMSYRSKVCRECYARGENPRKTAICPQCGRAMDYRAKTCRACQYPEPKRRELKGHPRRAMVDYSGLDPMWIAQFAGFFLADGCVSYDKNRHGTYRVHLRINVRADDEPLMLEIQSKLGGSISRYRPNTGLNSNDQVAWAVYGYSRTEAILDFIHPFVTLPARKARELSIAKEWCAWRRSVGNFLGEEGRKKCAEFADRLTQSKVFKELHG